MTPSIPTGETRVLGERALLVGVRDAAAARALAAALAPALVAACGRDAAEHAVEVVCGFATVGVVLTDPVVDLATVRDAVERVLAAGAEPATPADGRPVTIPCAFDGPDLDEVAARSGCSTGDVVAQLTAHELTVAVVGFSPGFAYLDGLPAPLQRVPRRAEPRPAVPAGSVALAGGHAAVYPTPSPGGWNLIGRTGFPLFSLEHPPFAVLAPGDRVQFSVAAADDPVSPPPMRPAPAWSAPGTARRVFEVVAPGLRAVLQDGGRRGVAAVGVPAAGAADPVSFMLANALVGNPAGAGALEITGGATRLRCVESCHAAIVGAAPELRVDGAPVPDGQLVPLAPGQALEVRGLEQGCRTYLAVAGGLLGPTAFASVSSDELCRLGAGPLEAGGHLWAGPWAPPLGDHLEAGARRELGAEIDTESPVELRVVPGPHPEWFERDALARLAATVFAVAAESNRVGLRLRAEGAPPTLRAGDSGHELDSQCVVTGAIQVPPDGNPVVLLPDHATLGGYPVLAVVAAADHGRLGQCGPGTPVRLVPIGAEEAGGAWRAQRRAVAGAVVGHYPLSAG